MNNDTKKKLIRFILAGTFALVLSKIEQKINEAAEEYFSEDEETQED